LNKRGEGDFFIIRSKINFPSPGACLREAASAKAGEGIEGRGMVRQAHHDHPEPVEGSPLSEPEALPPGHEPLWGGA